MSKGQLFIISAPSGAGKTSLVKALLDSLSDIEVSVSYTTRSQRPGEKAGVDYHFTTVDTFKSKISEEGLLEHAEVFGNFYGTSKSLVEERLGRGVDVILEIDWQGAQQVKSLMPSSCFVFILPPSKSVLEERLRGRGQDSDEVIAERMRAAVDEMSHYDEYEYVIVNDVFSQALAELSSVIKSQRLMLGRVKNCQQELIDKLLG